MHIRQMRVQHLLGAEPVLQLHHQLGFFDELGTGGGEQVFEGLHGKFQFEVIIIKDNVDKIVVEGLVEKCKQPTEFQQ